MCPKEAELIQEYFTCTSKLLEAKIVRSDKILGDIGEWLCVHKYNLILENSGRHPGYDGKIENSRVQVKVHNSPEGTNLSVGNPEKYDELIVILGPRSRLRVSDIDATFHAYRFSSVDVKCLMKRDNGYYCAMKTLKNVQPDPIQLET